MLTAPGDLQLGSLRAVPVRLVRTPLQGSQSPSMALYSDLPSCWNPASAPCLPGHSEPPSFLCAGRHLPEQNHPPTPRKRMFTGAARPVCVHMCVSDGLCLLRLRLRERRQRESNLPAFCMHDLSTRHRNEWEGGDSATQCRPEDSLSGVHHLCAGTPSSRPPLCCLPSQGKASDPTLVLGLRTKAHQCPREGAQTPMGSPRAR